jgi:hypothetical protein
MFIAIETRGERTPFRSSMCRFRVNDISLLNGVSRPPDLGNYRHCPPDGGQQPRSGCG